MHSFPATQRRGEKQTQKSGKKGATVKLRRTTYGPVKECARSLREKLPRVEAWLKARQHEMRTLLTSFSDASQEHITRIAVCLAAAIHHTSVARHITTPGNTRTHKFHCNCAITRMEDLNFTENSKVMFDEVCNASPWFVRHFTRNGLVKGLKAHGCGDVTEDMMETVCKEVTPPKYLENTLEILEKNKTRKS